MIPRVKRGMKRKISKNKTVEPSKTSKNDLEPKKWWNQQNKDTWV